MSDASVVALRCRTSDRTPGGVRGAEALAPRIARLLGVEPRLIGTPGEPRPAGFEDDLRDSRGCLLERTMGGRAPLALPNGQTRTFLEDGDRVTMTGWYQGTGYRIGFGEVTGKLLPVQS